MSEDGFSDCLDEPTMEVHIKTLLGTTFDIKVFPNDTVGDIKKKIYRVEGIPVYQQNLIFHSEELKDSLRLCDTKIRNGSTLTLISSMRGGPISTRRLSVACDHFILKELKDLLENPREDVASASKSKVSVLVFKEGDMINLLRVIENEDGSYSPYSDGPISPPSKPSRRETWEAFEKFVEDTEMCTKVSLLRKKMEELNNKKRSRKNMENVEAQVPSEKHLNKKKNVAEGLQDFFSKVLEGCNEKLLDSGDLTIIEKSVDSLEEGNQSETEEVALKDKHRTKPKILQTLPSASSSRSLYSERKGYSQMRQIHARFCKRRESKMLERAEKCSYTSCLKESDTSAWDDELFGPTSENNHQYLLDGCLKSNNDTQAGNSFLGTGPSSSSRLLPDLATRLNSRRLGPLIPNIASSSAANRPSLSSSYSLPSIDKLSESATLESAVFPTAQQLNGLSQSTSHSMGNMSGTLESTLPGLARIKTVGNLSGSRSNSPILEANEAVEEMGAKLAEKLHLRCPAADDEATTADIYGESLSVSATNRLHLTRLVLSSEGGERPKSSPDSIEHAQDLWEIHEPTRERLKHSATCKVGVLKRRQGLEYNYDSLENQPSNLKPELSNLGNYSKTSAEFEVCSGTNFYLPQFHSAPSAIPPQYAPKHHAADSNYCDLFFRDEPRSPLYSRRNRKENSDVKEGTGSSRSSPTVDGSCSSIQRIKNDEAFSATEKEIVENLYYGYYNLGCVTDLLEREEEKVESTKLAPVIKKKSRCTECNKRLNITNIYNCRCGRIFCSQHRYSEVHKCTYDYKSEGKKILERQNPLVTADKIQRF